MKPTKTYCFGRFLIDLPRDAEVNGQAYEFMFGKIESERLAGGEGAFKKTMREREVTLQDGKHEKQFKLVSTHGTESSDFRIFKLQKKLITISSAGLEFYKFIPNQLVFSMRETAFSVAQIDSVLNKIESRLLPNLRYRHPEDIPGEPGFCIKDGFIADSGQTPQYEYAELNFRFKQWPDVRVRVYSRTNGDKLGEPLLVRKQKPFPAEFAEAAKQIQELRKGAHNVTSLQGEEILEAYPTDGGFFVHHFVWDAVGKSHSTTNPAFYLTLDTGFIIGSPHPEVRPSLTDDQVIKLFDTIVNSIRLRPTTPGKASDAGNKPSADSGAAKALPLGTQVSSLRACPETGLYECPADAPGVEERRVFIEQGRPMPGAFTLQAKRGLAGMLGEQESRELETRWTLVAYKTNV